MAVLSGAYSATSSATLILRRNVLVKCPELPALNADIPVKDDWLKVGKSKARSVRHPLGRSMPVVLRGVEEGDNFEITFTCIDTDYDKLMALVDANRTLLVQDEKRQWYVEVANDVDIAEHLWDNAELDAREVTVPFIQVDIP